MGTTHHGGMILGVVLGAVAAVLMGQASREPSSPEPIAVAVPADGWVLVIDDEGDPYAVTRDDVSQIAPRTVLEGGVEWASRPNFRYHRLSKSMMSTDDGFVIYHGDGRVETKSRAEVEAALEASRKGKKP